MSQNAGTLLQVLAIFRLAKADLGRFEAYERAVLPLVEHHAGRLVRAVRAKDGEVEVHLLEFGTNEDFERFRADPRRQALSEEFIQSGAVAEVYETQDVDAYRA